MQIYTELRVHVSQVFCFDKTNITLNISTDF